MNKHLSLRFKCVLSVPMLIKRRNKHRTYGACGGNSNLPKELQVLWRNWEAFLKVLNYRVAAPREESTMELQSHFRQSIYAMHLHVIFFCLLMACFWVLTLLKIMKHTVSWFIFCLWKSYELLVYYMSLFTWAAVNIH